MKNLIILFTMLIMAVPGWSQENNYTKTSDEKIYKGGEAYDVPLFLHKFKSQKPKNVILMIGDGMGVTEVFAGITANHGHLFLDNFKSVGFSKTSSSNNYITDSAAGATALSAGTKTYNGAIGVNTDSIPVKTLLEEAEENELATGMVATSDITHATPASFIAHQHSRSSYKDIASDFLKTDIEVFIGGGYKQFAEREDGRKLVNELEDKGYKVLQDMKKIGAVKKGKLAGLAAPIHMGRVAERGDMLQVATKTAIKILNRNKKGFFLMVEGSQIDWGGHQNNTVYIIEEMLDFDKTIGKALEFAANDKETLIVVTADHETGGMAITGGNMETGMVVGAFTTGAHTAVMVPVFAYGPGADNFSGIMENTEIYYKIRKLLFED